MKNADSANLYQLLNQSSDAQNYFLALPDYVQGMLQQHSYEIKSLTDLYQFTSDYSNFQ